MRENRGGIPVETSLKAAPLNAYMRRPRSLDGGYSRADFLIFPSKGAKGPIRYGFGSRRNSLREGPMQVERNG